MTEQHSDDVNEELSRVTRALSAVFSHQQQPSTATQQINFGDPLDQRNAADKYLTSFQRLPIAWVVCDRILSSGIDGSVDAATIQQRMFFAAQTLHTKTREEVHQLPTERSVSCFSMLTV
mmetsp:Transcript_11621/g.11690  ORF Transcript_11621/g.11690 Transcript_11621/m.11690 type:complete len:120 (-) Transcript_11621:254-613(-)